MRDIFDIRVLMMLFLECWAVLVIGFSTVFSKVGVGRE